MGILMMILQKLRGGVNGVKIFSINAFKKMYRDESVVLIIATIYAKSVLPFLDEFSNICIYDMFDYYSKYDITTDIVEKSSKEDMDEFRKRCKKLYPLLADEESICVLEAHNDYLCKKNRGVFCENVLYGMPDKGT